MNKPLCVCFYHPTPSFQSITEHIAVGVDTPGEEGDMGLVALFGGSEAAGATPEQAAEARQQAQRFVASEDLLEACKAAHDAFCSIHLHRENGLGEAEIHLMQAKSAAKLRSAIAKAEGLES